MFSLYRKPCSDEPEYAAIALLKKGITEFPTSIYLFKELFDMYESSGDVNNMENTLNSINNIIESGRKNFTNLYTYRYALLLAHKKTPKITIALTINRTNTLSTTAKETLMKKVESILNKIESN